MSPAPGARIGNFEVIGPIGTGGMGEVYRARDTRLGRDVAIKILSPRIATDREAALRFEREARALATLNHPNIAAIYDVIESGGQPALILELVEGQTLADRIAVHVIAIDEAIGFAKQIADALDVAHESGIVHRDLKPGNIKVTEDGRIKVLDFGLAKAIAAASGELSGADLANSPTITVHGTHQGVILGTAAYMSPEQARGKRIDKRTDIWAFGCVLFEMLTGKRAFDGETSSDVIAAIIERAPDLNRLPPATPPHVRYVIERCLEKDPKRRARDIADVRTEFERHAVPVAAPRTSRVALAGMALVTLMAIGVAGTSWRWRSARVAPPAPVEFAFAAPPGYTLAPTPPVPSPDGQRIAFLARDEKQVAAIWIRSIDNPMPRKLDGTEGVDGAVSWSPDGRAIAFFVDSVWKRINGDGGTPVTIVANVQSNLGGSWGPNDMFLIAPGNRTSLSRVTVTGGSLQQVTTLDADRDNSHRFPQILPDGRHFLFTVRSDSPERLGIKLGSFDAGDTRTLVNVASSGVYVEPGWLLYVTPDEVLMAQRLDPVTWTIKGPAQQVAGPVRYNGPSFIGSFDASLDGRVIDYIPARRSGSTLEWFDRSGKSLGPAGPERAYRSVRLSNDGRRAVVELADSQVGTRDLWLLDTDARALTRLTSHPATDWVAVFSPDSSTIVFASDRAGASTLFRTPANGTGPETLLYRHSKGGGVFPVGWSARGNQVLLEASLGGATELLLIHADSGTPVASGSRQRPDGFVAGRLSPTGDLVAFSWRSSGTLEIDVMSLRDGQRVRVSTDGGSSPVWGPDGELFYYHARDGIMRAKLTGTTVVAKPQPLFRPCATIGRLFGTNPTEIKYDVSADAKRFLAVCDPPDVVPAAINVIVNWQSKLK
jgi:eukaryotic-like serine/threonine-protein kinase